METPSGSQGTRLSARKKVVPVPSDKGAKPKSYSVEALVQPHLVKIDQLAELLFWSQHFRNELLSSSFQVLLY